MSVKHLAVAADITGLSPTCKLLLYGLAIDADSDGFTSSTNPRLRKQTGLSERAIRTNMRKLEAMGLVETVGGRPRLTANVEIKL